MLHPEVCEECLQRISCAMKGSPRLPQGQAPHEIHRGTNINCFYHLCMLGDVAARRALRKGTQYGGLIPFGTRDKPHESGVGRYIAGEKAKRTGYEYGAVYVIDPATGAYVQVKRGVHIIPARR